MTRTVIVVDDDKGARSLCNLMFANAGFQVIQARDGQEALDHLAEKTVDLIFLDLAMPVLNGWDLMERLAQHDRFKKIPIIVQSAMYTTKQDEKRLSDLFSGRLQYAYFPRPTELAQIRKKAEELLASAQVSPADKATESGSSGTQQTPKRGRMLIVDDDGSTRHLNRIHFSPKGFEIIEAENAEEAWEILQKEKIDIMLLDLAMPYVSGEDLMKRMSCDERLKNIPIVVQTAMSPEGGRPQKLREFDGKLRYVCFVRPVLFKEVAAAVEKFLAEGA